MRPSGIEPATCRFVFIASGDINYHIRCTDNHEYFGQLVLHGGTESYPVTSMFFLSLFIPFLFPSSYYFSFQSVFPLFKSLPSFSLFLLVLLSFVVPSLPVSYFTYALSFVLYTCSCQPIYPHAPKQSYIHKHSNIFRHITYHCEISPPPSP